MLFNYHTHTIRCGHAVGTDREYVEAALKQGLKVLGFSDHAPYIVLGESESERRKKQEQIIDYAQSIRSLAKEYEKDLKIFCGFELEYCPETHDEEKEFLAQANPDYYILGQHFVGNDKSALTRCHIENDNSFLSCYVTQVIAGLATGDFLYLAHPDLPGWNFSKAVATREYLRICQFAKKRKIPLEFNFLGFADGRNYPSVEFFQLATEVGNEVVFGFDAHSPNAILNDETEIKARRVLEKLGLHPIETPLF